MILEAVLLSVKPGMAEAFEAAMIEAKPLIDASPGFRGMTVRPCVEQPGHYLLLVEWERLEDHTEGFRKSDRYAKWRAALHHFYDPFPTVEHFLPSIV
jgi:heme-degrading monooxygenase HmoA